MPRRLLAPALVFVLVAVGLLVSISRAQLPRAAAGSAVPRPDHVVVVMLENKNRSSVIGNASAPYLNSLAAEGANMSRSYGITHPSQPNYLGLFSGSQQGVTDDSCPHSFATGNLGRQLVAAGLSFTGYSESLPAPGYTGCGNGTYERKHSPWVNFANLPASANLPLTAFPTDFSKLPTLAFVTPNMCDDMHDCSVATGDSWLRAHLDPYAQWARTHHSLLVVSFDEDSGTTVNQITTVLVGQQVRPGVYPEQLSHYGLLRTIEDAYGLPALGNAATAAPLTTIWTTSPPPASGVVNGTFETGDLKGWSRSGSTFASNSTSSHGGYWRAAAGGTSTPTSGDSILAQSVVAPSGTSKLTVWWRGNCHDTVAKAWATIIVKHNDSGKVVTLLPRTCAVSTGWSSVTDSVTAGHSYTIQLISHDDGDAALNVSYFDDVALT